MSLEMELARYTNDFTPPQYEFQLDNNTVGLWHFNEGSGSQIVDATNNNNGNINGTSWSTNMPFTSYSTQVSNNLIYSWSPGGETTSSITVSPASTTTYTVDVTSGSTTCQDSVVVTVNPTQEISMILLHAIVFNGLATGLQQVELTQIVYKA